MTRSSRKTLREASLRRYKEVIRTRIITRLIILRTIREPRYL
jgi:hypothetical protein